MKLVPSLLVTLFTVFGVSSLLHPMQVLVRRMATQVPRVATIQARGGYQPVRQGAILAALPVAHLQTRGDYQSVRGLTTSTDDTLEHNLALGRLRDIDLSKLGAYEALQLASYLRDHPHKAQFFTMRALKNLDRVPWPIVQSILEHDPLSVPAFIQVGAENLDKIFNSRTFDVLLKHSDQAAFVFIQAAYEQGLMHVYEWLLKEQLLENDVTSPCV